MNNDGGLDQETQATRSNAEDNVYEQPSNPRRSVPPDISNEQDPFEGIQIVSRKV